MRRPLLYLHIALNFFMCCTPGMSAPPAWWTAGNPPVIDPAATPNSRGPANIGQAKWMAKNALEALRAVSPVTAAAVEEELVVLDPEAVPPENKPIKTWAAPTTPEEQAAQRAPLLIGQLKAISAPFYHHLNLLNPSWLQNELALNQTAVSGSHFPWTVETTDDANKAVATIGQLKAVFSLRFETLPVSADTDGDGMPDEWELAYGLDPNDPADAALDPDRDGLDSLAEFQIGTAPLGVYRVTETVLRETVIENGVAVAAPEEFLTAGEDGTVLTRQSAGSGWVHAFQWTSTGATRLGPFEFSNDSEPLAWVASDGTPHGLSNGGTPLNTFKHPDLIQPLAPIDWATISGSLSLDPAPTAAAPSGEVTLHRDAAGDYHFVHRDGTVSNWDAPPKSSVDLSDISWQIIDDSGDCVTSYMKINPTTSEQEGRILWWGQSQLTEISVPEEWQISSPPVVQFLDNEGSALVRYETTEPDQSFRTRYSLLHLMSESFTEIHLPEAGSAIASISSTDNRIVGNGPSPWFTLADSTTLSIAKLRVRNNSGDSEVPMVSIYSQPCEARHITSQGLVTLIGSNSENQRVLIRVVANNDADDDGVPDDWEKWWAKQLLATNIEFTPQQLAELESGNLSANADYTGDGMSMAHQFVSLPPVVTPPGPLNSYWKKPQLLVQIRGLYHQSVDAGDPDRNHTMGYAWVGGSDGGIGENIWDFQPPAKYQPSALVSQMDSLAPWRGDLGGAGYLADLTTVYSASSLSTPQPAPGGATKYFASADQSRFKVIRSVPGKDEVKVSFVRLKRNTNSPAFGYGTISNHYPGEANNGTEEVEIVDVIIPKNRTSSDWVEVKANFIEGKYAQVLYTPVEVVELSPKVKDEEGNDVEGSELPSTGRPLTPLVELNPVTDRIAHRELKVKIGWPLKGKKVTWTLAAVPGSAPATIRGQWAHSTTHSDRFEVSATYGANGYTRLSQASGRTTVDDDGFTAIRVNVPPVGFNQVRIQIQIEGEAALIDLIDMEVPGVVVVDPGHGGTSNLTGSNWNNATSPSGVLEKAMALNYGLALRDSLRAIRNTDRLNLRVFMTREVDQNITGAARAAVARDNGADIIHIIHFNASETHTARGTLEVYRTTNNVFPQQDTILSEGIITRMVTGMTPYDAGANHRARVANDTAVASDANNGNTAAYCPVRTAYIEVEFIDYGAHTTTPNDDLVDILLNTGPNAAAVKTAIANAMRDGILHDLRNHQPQP